EPADPPGTYGPTWSRVRGATESERYGSERTVPMDVLLIEDDEDIGAVVRDLLVSEGFATEVARNGEEGLDALRRTQPPKLILLDLMMPVMDGWQFRERQLRDPRLADVATVILSGVPDVSEVARNLNVAAWLGKPLSADRLVGVVRRY